MFNSPLLPVSNYRDAMHQAHDGTIRTVGIVGSGIMGSGLAEVVAKAGFQAIVRCRTTTTAHALKDSILTSLDRQVTRNKLESGRRDTIVAAITTTADLGALESCDLIIESVIEDLEIKRQLFGELDQIAQPRAILATNTSTLPVVDLAMSTGRPTQVCGIHFFNPATAMPLVEIVRPLTASDETISAALSFAAACGKDAVEVKDRAGFIVNALLFPYLNNAVRMAELGTASIDSIDRAMRGGCNFPMGPFALLDLVGLDTSLAILDALYNEFRDPNYAAAPTLRRMVSAGHLGKKSGRGFFDYSR